VRGEILVMGRERNTHKACGAGASKSRPFAMECFDLTKTLCDQISKKESVRFTG
jgi:hypothetical protein